MSLGTTSAAAGSTTLALTTTADRAGGKRHRGVRLDHLEQCLELRRRRLEQLFQPRSQVSNGSGKSRAFWSVNVAASGERIDPHRHLQRHGRRQAALRLRGHRPRQARDISRGWRRLGTSDRALDRHRRARLAERDRPRLHPGERRLGGRLHRGERLHLAGERPLHRRPCAPPIRSSPRTRPSPMRRRWEPRAPGAPISSPSSPRTAPAALSPRDRPSSPCSDPAPTTCVIRESRAQRAISGTQGRRTPALQLWVPALRAKSAPAGMTQAWGGVVLPFRDDALWGDASPLNPHERI